MVAPPQIRSSSRLQTTREATWNPQKMNSRRHVLALLFISTTGLLYGLQSERVEEERS